MVQLVLGEAVPDAPRLAAAAWPSLRGGWVAVILEVLAAAALAANWPWLPMVTEVRPDPGLLLVARPVLAVGNVLEGQPQFQHEGPRL